MGDSHSRTDPERSGTQSGTATEVGPVTIAEAARLLGVVPRTISKYREQGKVRGIREGKTWAIWVPRALIDRTDPDRSGTRSEMDPDRSGSGAGGETAPLGDTPEPIEAAYRVAGEGPPVALVPLATMVEELRGLADQLADLARRNEGLALEVGQLRERNAGQGARLAAKDEMIAELHRRGDDLEGQRDAAARELAGARRRAEAAEGEAAALRERLAQAESTRIAATRAPEALEAPTATDTTPDARRGAQGLWRRVRRALGGR